ncbi:glycosyltransferase [Paenibacillus sp. N4]|nr:glycosyltransferase [Paenibacillus vietnamensis]
MPIYNVEKYIHKCVESLMNQTYKNIEIILVDDGSPDNCPSICDEYAKKDYRVRVIHKDNGGLSDARNSGMDDATGEFIIFVDGDDYVKLNMVEKAIGIAHSTKSNVVIWGFSADYVDENDTLIKSIIHKHESGVFDKYEYNNIVFGKDLIGNLGYAWNKMYSMVYLKGNGFKFTKGLSLVEDIVFNSLVLSRSEKIAFLDEPLIHYVQRPRMTLGNKFYEDYFEIKQKGIVAVESLLLAWNQDVKVISKIIGSLLLGSIRTTISHLSRASTLSITNRKEYLDKILYNSAIIDKLDDVELASLKEKVIYKLIRLKQSYALLLFYKLFQK